MINRLRASGLKTTSAEAWGRPTKRRLCETSNAKKLSSTGFEPTAGFK